MDKSDILKKYWGYDRFRNNQEEIIDAVLDGKDVLALLPTGGGKSICYQIPALLRDGICLVVSPLISLMQDQVQNLNARGIKATAITSGLTYKQIDIRLDNAVNDPNLKFLYVSPERLKTRLFIERLKKMTISLIAVDEAHCISQWGYDFRPAYLNIADIRDVQPKTPLMALTATATQKVADDIIDKLSLNDGTFIRSSFERENLAYKVVRTENKKNVIVDYLVSHEGCGIIYCGTRKQTKIVTQYLNDSKISADFYHGGLDQEEREKKQIAWQRDEIRVMVATNAFGMGIDKPDVRFVLHNEVPENLESYSQEAGRAGRDGMYSEAVLFVAPDDLEKLKEKIELKFPPIDVIKTTYDKICSKLQIAIGAGKEETYPFSISEFAEQNDRSILEVYHCIKFLERSGFIQLLDPTPHQATLEFTCSSDELYNFRLKNELNDRLVQFLLRTHIGIINGPVRLNEYQICKKLSLNKSIVRKVFQNLADQELAIYSAASDKSKIFLITERLKRDNLSIPKELYHNRKELALQKFVEIRSYIESNDCLAKLIRSYFGDEAGESCGVCSVCLSHKPKTAIDHIAGIIVGSINGEFHVNELFRKHDTYSKNEILQALRLLSDKEIVELNKDGKVVRLRK